MYDSTIDEEREITASEQRTQGRPTSAAGSPASRRDLLEIAWRSIAGRGFDATSIRGLAREAGVTHGTVQYHFATKDDLWKAIVDELIVPELTRLVPDPDRPADEVVADAIQSRLTVAADQPGLVASILLDGTEGAERRLRYLLEANQSNLQRGSETFDHLVDSGQLRDIDPAVLGAILTIALPALISAGPAMNSLFGIDITDSETRDHLTHQLTDIVLNGILSDG